MIEWWTVSNSDTVADGVLEVYRASSDTIVGVVKVIQDVITFVWSFLASNIMDITYCHCLRAWRSFVKLGRVHFPCRELCSCYCVCRVAGRRLSADVVVQFHRLWSVRAALDFDFDCYGGWSDEDHVRTVPSHFGVSLWQRMRSPSHAFCVLTLSVQSSHTWIEHCVRVVHWGVSCGGVGRSRASSVSWPWLAFYQGL